MSRLRVFRVTGSRQGFTLLELLAAITVGVVLVGLLLVTGEKVLGASRAVSCISNLRQIGGALQLYLGDHDGTYPPNRANPAYQTPQNTGGVHHQESLKEYLNLTYTISETVTAKMAGPFWCPADTARKNKFAYQSYGANSYIGGAEPAEQQNIRREAKPSQRLYLLDTERANQSTSLFSHNTWPFNNSAADKPDTDPYVDFRHAGHANGLFLDGHVTTFAVRNLRGQRPSEWIPSP